METAPSSSFLARHEFLIRRLFSLCGLVPVGAYMVIHLLTNASLMDSSATFQKAVYQIHGLGGILPVIEWVFIFLPIIFHAVLGIVIIRGGLPNSGTYNYPSNVRYTLQRATGMIAFLFIFLHVFHMHGWIHADWWLKVAEPLGGAKFKPYNAASSLASAFQGGIAWTVFYTVGVLSCVYHLSNGIWSAGVRWGVWISPAAMQRASLACTIFGVLLGLVSLSALIAPHRVKIDEAQKIEADMYQAKVAGHEVEPNEHKRTPASEQTKPAVAPATDVAEPSASSDTNQGPSS